jgi:hypothetical protein
MFPQRSQDHHWLSRTLPQKWHVHVRGVELSDRAGALCRGAERESPFLDAVLEDDVREGRGVTGGSGRVRSITVRSVVFDFSPLVDPHASQHK